jgi:hypothetical protein
VRGIVEFMKTSEAAPSRRDFWRELLLKHEKSGMPVQAFCQQHGVSWHSFYQWRKRLAKSPPVRFALVETQPANEQPRAGVELWLSGGDRLHIAAGVDGATLRTVLAILRERQ